MIKHSRQLVSTIRVKATPTTDNLTGRVIWDAPKSIFYSVMLASGLLAIPYAQLIDWLAFVLLSGVTILAGHSVGMHRLLIHRSFKTPKWIEYLLVYLGVLVGMAGPVGMIRLHDTRDWHQRQSQCPAYPSHAGGFWQDAYWQLHCAFVLENPPQFALEPTVSESRFYRFLERTWMLQQIPVALALYYVGGFSMVGIGVGLRVFVSLTGHWIVGHMAHKRGTQRWVIDGLPVQGYNLPYLSWLTFGENWHGNHHAFPESALLGIESDQHDPGFAFVRLLESCGLASEIIRPESCPKREGLRLLKQN